MKYLSFTSACRTAVSSFSGDGVRADLPFKFGRKYGEQAARSDHVRQFRYGLLTGGGGRRLPRRSVQILTVRIISKAFVQGIGRKLLSQTGAVCHRAAVMVDESSPVYAARIISTQYQVDTFLLQGFP